MLADRRTVGDASLQTEPGDRLLFEIGVGGNERLVAARGERATAGVRLREIDEHIVNALALFC